MLGLPGREVEILLCAVMLLDAAGLGALALLDVVEKRRARHAHR